MPSAKPVSEMMPFWYISTFFLVRGDSLVLCFFPFILTLSSAIGSLGSLILLFFGFENSVFTPYYSETVLYSSSELQKENEDGISTLFYLQKIFPGIVRSHVFVYLKLL